MSVNPAASAHEYHTSHDEDVGYALDIKLSRSNIMGNLRIVTNPVYKCDCENLVIVPSVEYRYTVFPTGIFLADERFFVRKDSNLTNTLIGDVKHMSAVELMAYIDLELVTGSRTKKLVAPPLGRRPKTDDEELEQQLRELNAGHGYLKLELPKRGNKQKINIKTVK